ncbi:acyl-CoA synthetase [Dasania sp. GY-MA-18]|uniref:acyl-CoA synthetase n=1 Tax=Dasania sp. GY-MA-18 TaxID=2966584 RepID=UPI0021ACA2FA|nr:acyl-CoA synthetase [Dasania sp. GY-MA-18]MCR8924342.1 acyl-CoA synthetase [Dasania sp. GY-MA-18]
MSQTVAHALHHQSDIEEFEKTPRSQRYPWSNSYELIQQAGLEYGDDPALSFLPTGVAGEQAINISYRELAAKVTQTANLLHSLGVTQGDAVSLLLPSLLQTHYTLWGAQAAGIAGPINPMLEAEHITEIMNATRSKVLITLAPSENSELWQKVCQMTQSIPSLKTIILISQSDKNNSELPSSPKTELRIVDYTQQLELQPSDKLLSGRQFNAEQIAAYMHTGGTTGCPKVAKLTHGGLTFVGQIYADTAGHLGRYTTLCGLPLFHIFGIVATGLALFASGRHGVLLSPSGFRNPNIIQNFWHHTARFNCKAFSTVPTILGTLLDQPLGDNNISCLQEVACGATPLPNQLKKNFEQRFEVKVRNGYGMTESSCLMAKPPGNTIVPTSSVGLRLPYTRRITAVIEGSKLIRECGVNESGVVLAQGPNIFSGYLNNADNNSIWIDGQWFNTGDVGYHNEQGNLFLCGRAKDLIIRGGHNIDPLIIEVPLSKHPAIAQAVAIGQPDPYAGEVPIAYVKLKTGKNISSCELLDYCKEVISERAAIPKRIEFIDEIPLTAVSKVFKPALRQLATEFAINASLAKADIKAEIKTRIDTQHGLIAKVLLHNNDQHQQAVDLLQAYPLIIEF